MKRWGFVLIAWLAATTTHADGITSFEPDSTKRVAPDREPMIETPIWLGTGFSVSSLYRPGADGLFNGPMNFTGVGFGATWPWRSRRQGYVEWLYGMRHVRHELPGLIFTGGGYAPYTFIGTEHVSMLALRGGVEQRFGRRRTPWCTLGGGLGYAFNLDDQGPVTAFELAGRATWFVYPTQTNRVGLMLTAGPAWHSNGEALRFTSSGSGDEPLLRTHFEIALRLEHRLRFPKANADADAAD